MITPIQRFYNRLEISPTRETYVLYLNKFFEYCKTSHELFLGLKEEQIEDLISEYLVSLKRRIEADELSPNSIRVIISPILLFCQVNRKRINEKYIRQQFPRKKPLLNQGRYTDNEVKKMLGATRSLRNKMLIQVLASTGARIGALHELKWNDITPIENGAVLTCYADDIEEYQACLTPEAYKALMNYREYLVTNRGKIPTKDSFVFLDIHCKRRMKKDAMRQVMTGILKQAGLRGKNIERSRTGKSTNHAFRKRYETILVNAGLHSKYVEFLMGHFEKQTDRNYFKPTYEEIWNQFKIAIPLLTLDKSESYLSELEASKEEVKTYEIKHKVKIEDLENIMVEKNDTIEDLTKRLQDVEKIVKSMNKI